MSETPGSQSNIHTVFDKTQVHLALYFIIEMSLFYESASLECAKEYVNIIIFYTLSTDLKKKSKFVLNALYNK